MKTRNNIDKIILILTLPIVILMTINSLIGLFTPGIYNETDSWLSQCTAQDISNLVFIAPVLLISALLSARGFRVSRFIWGGSILANIYSFLLYGFSIHQNRMFLIYCAILGLSVYAAVVFFADLNGRDYVSWFNDKLPIKKTSILLVSCGIFFAILWLSEIIPAMINNAPPAATTDYGLPVNPVHTIDISFTIPFLLISGIALLLKKEIALILAPTALILLTAVNINIFAYMTTSVVRGNSGNIPLVIFFSVLSVLSSIFSIFMLAKIKNSKL